MSDRLAHVQITGPTERVIWKVEDLPYFIQVYIVYTMKLEVAPKELVPWLDVVKNPIIRRESAPLAFPSDRELVYQLKSYSKLPKEDGDAWELFFGERLGEEYCRVEDGFYIYIHEKVWDDTQKPARYVVKNLTYFNEDGVEYTHDFEEYPEKNIYVTKNKASAATKDIILVTTIRDFLFLTSWGFPAIKITDTNYRYLPKPGKGRRYILIPSILEELSPQILTLDGFEENEFLEVIGDMNMKELNVLQRDGTTAKGDMLALLENAVPLEGTTPRLLNDGYGVRESLTHKGYEFYTPDAERTYDLTDFVIKYKNRVGNRGDSKMIVNIYGPNSSSALDVELDNSIFAKPEKFIDFFLGIDNRFTVRFPAAIKSIRKTDILLYLKNYLNNSQKTLITKELSKVGYDGQKKITIFPTWAARQGSSHPNDLDSPLGSFFVSSFLSVDFPELSNMRAKYVDSDYYRAMDELSQAFFTDCNGRYPMVVFPMVMGYCLASFYSHFIYRDIGHFPILNIHGNRASGKTFLMQVINEAFGIMSSNTGAGSTSVAGLVRTLNQYNSGYFVFDEMTHGATKEDYSRYESILRSNFDGGERIIGGRTDNSSVTRQQIKCPIVCLGESEFMDNAVRTRSLMMRMPDVNSKGVPYLDGDSIMNLATVLQPYMKNFIANVSESNWHRIWKPRISHAMRRMRERGATSRQSIVYGIPSAFAEAIFRNHVDYKEFVYSVDRSRQNYSGFAEYDDVMTVLKVFAESCRADERNGIDKFRNTFAKSCDEVLYFSPSAILVNARSVKDHNIVIPSVDSFREALKMKNYYVDPKKITMGTDKRSICHGIKFDKLPPDLQVEVNDLYELSKRENYNYYEDVDETND